MLTTFSDKGLLVNILVDLIHKGEIDSRGTMSRLFGENG